MVSATRKRLYVVVSERRTNCNQKDNWQRRTKIIDGISPA